MKKALNINCLEIIRIDLDSQAIKAIRSTEASYLYNQMFARFFFVIILIFAVFARADNAAESRETIKDILLSFTVKINELQAQEKSLFE